MAVIGVLGTTWGEAVEAECFLESGRSVAAASVLAWAQERITGFKSPDTVDLIQTFPAT